MENTCCKYLLCPSKARHCCNVCSYNLIWQNSPSLHHHFSLPLCKSHLFRKSRNLLYYLVAIVVGSNLIFEGIIRIQYVRRGGSRTTATSKMERFVIILQGLPQSAPSWVLQQSQTRLWYAKYSEKLTFHVHYK